MSEMRDGMTLMDLLRLLKRFAQPIVAAVVGCTVLALIATAVAGLFGFDGDPVKYAVVALLCSLFVAVVVVVAWDSWKMPVKSADDLESAFGIYVLGNVPGKDGGERLFSNLMFVAGDRAGTSVAGAGEAACGAGAEGMGAAGMGAAEAEASGAACAVGAVAGAAGAPCDELRVAVVPVGSQDDASEAAGELMAAASAFGDDSVPVVSTVECSPLSEGMGAAWEARESDAVIVAVAEWRDSMRDAEATLRELAIAGCKPVGFALVAEDLTEEGR